MTNFTSAPGGSTSRFAQCMRADSPLPGHFTSTIGLTPFGTLSSADVPAGFDQHFAAGVEQPLHQRVHVRLQQRFAAGDLDERALVAEHLRHHVVDGHLPSTRERIRRVAPAAAQIAGG